MCLWKESYKYIGAPNTSYAVVEVQSSIAIGMEMENHTGIRIVESPPYAIPYGRGIPNPIYGYRYGVGIMRLIRKVVDMMSKIGELGSEKKKVYASEIKILK